MIVGSVVISYLNKDGVAVTRVVATGQQFDPATGAVTPIPDFNPKEMSKPFQEIGGNPNMPPAAYAVDKTIYYVSPTTGDSGNGVVIGGGGQ